MRKLASLLIACCLMVIQVWAQTKTVTGIINDPDGKPLTGVTITAKLSGRSTATNEAGRFTLAITSSEKTLEISAVNYTTQTVIVGNQNTISITLTTTSQNLSDVVVVGYSTVSKRNITGAVSKIDGNQLENRPVLSFDQALTGKAAGVQVNTSSGLVGDNVIIRVRGAASINNSSQPLIIIDGTPIVQGNVGQLYNPTNALQDLNPNDIESVEVLKDASAAAIYGSRASAGVILITTKKGKAGSTRVTYDGYVGLNQPMNKLNVLDASQFATVINKERSNAGLSNVINSSDINKDGQPDQTDWQDAVYRNGMTHNHQVSMSGGNNRSTYYGSASYTDFENYIINNRLRRGSVRLNATTKATNWLTLGINTQFSRSFQNGIGSGTGGALSGVPLGPLRYYPNVPIYDSIGNYYLGAGGNTLTHNFPNPVAVLLANRDNTETKRFLGSAYAEAQIISGLRLKTQINIDYQTNFTEQFWSPDFGDGQGSGGISQNVNSENRNWSWFSTVNYNKRIGKDHDISVLAGTEFTKRMNSFDYLSGVGLKDPALQLITTGNYTSVSGSEGFGENGLASYFAGLTYGFRGKYLFTANFRSDAYSGFGKEYRFGKFPSASVAWRVSDEIFFNSIKSTINDFKIRASYGITGNSNIGNYPALASYASATYAELVGASAITLNNPGNTSLRWERTEQTDIGFDMSLFKSRVNITFDYYKKKTRDLILANPVLATLGFPGNSITQNIGRLETKGLELAVQSENFRGKNFTWSTNFNIAYNKNVVTATNEAKADITGTNNVARPGEELGVFYLIRWAGVSSSYGNAMFYDVNGNVKMYVPATSISAARWTDDKGGATTTAISAADRVILKGKTPYPKYYGGITNNFRFHQFDLSVDLQYALDYYLYNSTLQGLLAYNNVQNKSVEILKAWDGFGSSTNIPRLNWNDNLWSQTSDRWLEKGDFLRIRNTQLGYSLPRNLISRMSLTNLRFYAQVQNLYTFTGYKGIDPEANANGNTNIGLGIDNNRPYLPRTFTIGVNVGL